MILQLKFVLFAPHTYDRLLLVRCIIQVRSTFIFRLSVSDQNCGKLPAAAACVFLLFIELEAINVNCCCILEDENKGPIAPINNVTWGDYT